jgi:histidyl-tRNA synthetase
LRSLSFSVELDLSGSAFGKQFKRADRSGAVGCLILGDAEAQAQSVQLKWLSSGEQTSLDQAALLMKPENLKQQISMHRCNTLNP